MPLAYWRLKYDRNVTAKLYDMRERGFAVHGAIKQLMYQREPWSNSTAIGGRSGWYEFQVEGCFVGFAQSADPEDTEPTLLILYVVEISL